VDRPWEISTHILFDLGDKTNYQIGWNNYFYMYLNNNINTNKRILIKCLLFVSNSFSFLLLDFFSSFTHTDTHKFSLLDRYEKKTTEKKPKKQQKKTKWSSKRWTRNNNSLWFFFLPLSMYTRHKKNTNKTREGAQTDSMIKKKVE
jgi:hypothetical protein